MSEANEASPATVGSEVERVVRHDRCSVPVDYKGEPLITTEMKQAAWGEFYVMRLEENEFGDVEQVRLTIPWTTCKEIYKTMVNAGRKST